MATFINAKGNKKEIKPKNGKDFDLHEVQELIGGYIELVRIPLDNNHIMLVDEEGRLKNLPHNRIASGIAHQYIVGDVIVCKTREFK